MGLVPQTDCNGSYHACQVKYVYQPVMLINYEPEPCQSGAVFTFSNSVPLPIKPLPVSRAHSGSPRIMYAVADACTPGLINIQGGTP